MAVVTYEDVLVTDSIYIANTTMKKRFYDGVHKQYTIVPNEGYVLHDKNYDVAEVDPNTMMETGNIILGYRTSTASCPASYDFTANPREYYAVLESSVPADQIFGGGGNDHEVMSEGKETTE